MRDGTGQSGSPNVWSSRRRFLLATAGIGVVSTIGTATAGATQHGGEVRWEYTESSDEVGSSPTVVSGTVYIGRGGGTVDAIDADTGDQEWVYDVGRDERVESAPSVVDGTVYVGAEDRRLHAIDADTGREAWTFRASNAVYESPAAVDGTVFLATGEDLYAIDADTGEPEWTFEEPSDSLESATVVDGVVYVGSADGTLYAVNAATGEREWAFTEPSNGLTPATVAGDMAYVRSGAEALYAVDIDSGEAVWTAPLSGDSFSPSSPGPTVADGVVYVTFLDGFFSVGLTAIDANSGEEIWSVNELNGNAYTSPTLVDGALFLALEGGVHALDAATGNQVWELDASVSFSSPTVVDGVIYVGSNDGTVYAIEAGPDGSSEDSRVRLGTDGHHDDRSERVTKFGAVHFEVDIVATNAPVSAGEEVTVEIETTNRGFERGEQPVEITGGGFIVDTQTVTLGAGDSITNTVFWESTEADAGEHEITVASPVDAASITVVVEDPVSDDGNGDELADDADGDDGSRGDADALEDSSAADADEQPGLGIASALAALGGAGYLRTRRFAGRNG